MMKEMDTKLATNQAKVTKQKEMLAEISARMDTNLNEMQEEIKSSQAEMRSTLDERLMDLKDGRKEMIACKEVTETKLDPGLMQ
jgi:DNA anti-recombination protein RmuC